MCEQNTLPAPTANTISSGEVAPPVAKGDTIPAAVSPATVADPRDTRSNAVMIHANRYGLMFY